MKFLISIIMVLLMINLFAQAQAVRADSEGATAMKVNDGLTAEKVEPGSAYSKTMTGIPTGGNQNVQGQQKPCEKTDANGNCHPMPNKSTVANAKGKGVKGSGGKTTGATPATAGKATK